MTNRDRVTRIDLTRPRTETHMDWTDYYADPAQPLTTTKGPHMETGTTITQVQPPELYLAADVEPYQKGGWKTTVKASIRMFDGDAAAMYIQLESMLQSGLAVAHNAIQNHEAATKEATNE